MRILHICCGYDLDYQGGITNYVRSLAHNQYLSGNNVFVLADGGKNNGYTVIKNITNLKSFCFSKKSRKNYLFLKRFFKYNSFDVIHIHMILNLDKRVYRIINKFKVIVSLHDYFYLCPRISMVNYYGKCCNVANAPECMHCFSFIHKYNFACRVLYRLRLEKNMEKLPLRSPMVYRIRYESYKKLLENAFVLLAVSNRVKEIYENSGIKGNYQVLHIGNQTALDFDDIHDKKCENEINLVILSTVSRIKGGDLLVRLFSNVKNPLLKIHFFGRANNKHDLEILAKLNAINHGEYAQKDLKNILHEMDMGLVCPIWEDNAPQVVMEMLNNHVPIFGTKMGGITDFVSSKNGFLFNPGDENDINKAIEFLNGLTCGSVNAMAKNIKPTITPQQHCAEIMNFYKGVKK